MSPDPELTLPDELQELIVDVVDGRCPTDAARVRQAGELHPGFADALTGALRVRHHLDAFHQAEAAALAAPPSELEAVAEAAAREQLRRAIGRSRFPRWLPLLVAAALVLAISWFGFLSGGGRRPGNEHLGKPGAVAIRFDALQHTIELSPAPVAGEAYRVEFGTGDHAIEAVPDVRAARLAVPDLRRYLPDLWVRAVLLEAGERTLQSDRIPVPADFWR